MRFLYPKAAFLFLFLLFLLVLSLRKPISKRIILPSLDFLEQERGRTGKPLKRLSGRFRISFPFFLFLSGMCLLVIALATPVLPPHFNDSSKDDIPIFVYYDHLPSPVLRVLEKLDHVVIGNHESLPAGTFNLFVSASSPSPPFPEGNSLFFHQVPEESERDVLSEPFQVLFSDSNHETVRFLYTLSDTKSVQFPIKIADAVDHFRREGVNAGRHTDTNKERLPFWITVAAGILLLCGMCWFSNRE